MSDATRCPGCGRPMTWGGSRANSLQCAVCDTPKSFAFDGMAQPKEESITDLKNRGICYCHLMINRTCSVCVARGPKP
jgi:hypothetical protein